MNSKITLGNALSDLALLKLEHDKLRSAEGRRQGDTDFARAKEKESDAHVVVFDTGAKLFANLGESLAAAAKDSSSAAEQAQRLEPAAPVTENGATEAEDSGISAEEAQKLEQLASLMEDGAAVADLAAEIGAEFMALSEERRAILDGLPYAQDRADLLSLLQRIGSVLTQDRAHRPS